MQIIHDSEQTVLYAATRKHFFVQTYNGESNDYKLKHKSWIFWLLNRFYKTRHCPPFILVHNTVSYPQLSNIIKANSRCCPSNINYSKSAYRQRITRALIYY